MNAVGGQPAGVSPVSPGSRMSTRARPPLTVTSGAPSALRATVTRGVLAGGAGGSAASVVTGPACTIDETNTDGAARDLAAAGRSEAGQRDHRRLAVRPLTRTGGVRGLTSETVGNGERGVAPGVGIHALGNGIDKC